MCHNTMFNHVSMVIPCLTNVYNGFHVICGKIKGQTDYDMLGIINTNCKLL